LREVGMLARNCTRDPSLRETRDSSADNEKPAKPAHPT
jgi:hypothetical protein